MVICLERGADLHTAQPMPLPLTISCFSKIQIGFTFLVLAHSGSPGKWAVKRVCVCVCISFDLNSNGLCLEARVINIQVITGGGRDRQLCSRACIQFNVLLSGYF